MLVHVCADVHALPHERQFIAVPSGVSQPSDGRRLQSANPGSQRTIEHVLVTHEAVALAKAHGWPQAPQLARSLSSDSHPSAGIALQSAVPATHRNVHAPAEQTGVELGRLRHALPQAPQCSTLLARSTSQPSAAIMLQFSKPGSQAPSTHAEFSQLVVA